MRNYYLDKNEPGHCSITNSDWSYFRKSAKGQAQTGSDISCFTPSCPTSSCLPHAHLKHNFILIMLSCFGWCNLMGADYIATPPSLLVFSPLILH